MGDCIGKRKGSGGMGRETAWERKRLRCREEGQEREQPSAAFYFTAYISFIESSSQRLNSLELTTV